MATRLEKTLRRELLIDGRPFVVAISSEGLKLTLKGHRKGQELRWSDLVSGEAALAAALNASVGRFEPRRAPTAAATSRMAPPAGAAAMLRASPTPAAAPTPPARTAMPGRPKQRAAATIRRERERRPRRR